MNTDDPAGIDKRLPREERLLEEADIAEADREAISDFEVHRKANKDNDGGTLAAHLKHLRVTAERADIPLTEMGKLDLDRFIVEEMQEKRGLAAGTIRQYKCTYRPFFRFLDREWAEDIELEEMSADSPDETKLFSDEEIQGLLEAGDSRATAAIALYADTGLRAAAIASLRVKDIDLEGDVAVIHINEDAHVKGAEGSTPLSWSRGYVANYLSGDHPRPGEKDAALIHKKQGYDGEDGAVSTPRLRMIFKELADDAGIERERMKIHNFRHTAITRWRRQGLPDHVIKHRAKWVNGETMLEVYDQVTDEERNQDIAVAMGLIDGEDATETPRNPGDEVIECPVCHLETNRGARYCPGCGNPMNADAAEGVPPEDVQDPEETAEDLADIDGVLDEMGTAAIIERLIQQNPSLLEELDFDV